MNQNQMLVAELTKHVEHMENTIINADCCDESELLAIDRARELLADIHAAMA